MLTDASSWGHIFVKISSDLSFELGNFCNSFRLSTKPLLQTDAPVSSQIQFHHIWFAIKLCFETEQHFTAMASTHLYCCFYLRRSQQVNGSYLASFFHPDLVKYSHLEAGEALEHGLLRPLSSNLRSEVTSEAIWRPLWPQRPP